MNDNEMIFMERAVPYHNPSAPLPRWHRAPPECSVACPSLPPSLLPQQILTYAKVATDENYKLRTIFEPVLFWCALRFEIGLMG